MKINKIVYKSFSDMHNVLRFDMNKKVRRQNRVLMPLAWALSFPETFKRKLVIRRHNMEPLKKVPYLLLCNHNAFYDFKVATRAIFPRRATYVVAIDGFIDREALMRQVGCFGKRKFINDIGLIKQIRHSLYELKHITVIYPEARYSLVGTNHILPDSLGKLVKLLKVPVATLITKGNHLSSPVWNTRFRKVNTEADLTQLITKEESETLSVEEINDRINQAFVYDDYAWQKEKGVEIKEPWRAEGLEKVLYKCPSCLAEGEMKGTGSVLKCNACQKEWFMETNGTLSAIVGETEFSHIPAWHEWQRQEVVKEIENGTYSFSHEVAIDSLPSSKGFYRIGSGILTHDINGFKIVGKSQNGEDFVIEKKPEEHYSIHIEFNYFGRGDGISLSYPQDTYYFFGHDPKYTVTKAHFAVEELYKRRNK
jgi:hypothetical protein